jgi:hypothetical protein
MHFELLAPISIDGGGSSKLVIVERIEMGVESDVTTPFCLGCGDWILEPPELNDSPFYYCISCTPKKRLVKVRKR